MTEYDRLSIELMSKMTGKELPENWRFTVQAKRLLAIHVCCITGLSQDRWDTLSKAKRIPWLQKAIDAVEGTSIEGEWIEGEDLSDYRPTEAYKPGSELNRILSDLNDSLSTYPVARKGLVSVPSPIDEARRVWIPMLRDQLSKFPELAGNLTEDSLRQWLWDKLKIPPTLDFTIDQLINFFEQVQQKRPADAPGENTDFKYANSAKVDTKPGQVPSQSSHSTLPSSDGAPSCESEPKMHTIAVPGQERFVTIHDFTPGAQPQSSEPTDVPLDPILIAASEAMLTSIDEMAKANTVVRNMTVQLGNKHAGSQSITIESAPTPPSSTPALIPDSGAEFGQLLQIYTNGVYDERMKQAEAVRANKSLSVDMKLTKIDSLIPFPASTSAQKLADALGVTKQAVMKTKWWKANRKGEKDNEVGRRRNVHRQRANTVDLPLDDEDN